MTDLDRLDTEILAAACRTAAVSSAHADLFNAVAARMLAMLSWIDGAKVDMAAMEEELAERDDWRRRYEALRDGVTGLADRLTWKRPEHSPCGTPEQIEACCGSEQSCDAMNPSVLLCGASDLRAVVARVEGS